MGGSATRSSASEYAAVRPPDPSTPCFAWGEGSRPPAWRHFATMRAPPSCSAMCPRLDRPQLSPNISIVVEIWKKHTAIAALAALAQDNRLDVFRLLVKAGHRHGGRRRSRRRLGCRRTRCRFTSTACARPGSSPCTRESRSLIYAAQFDTMNTLIDFLTENCCAGVADDCGPSCAAPASQPASKGAA